MTSPLFFDTRFFLEIFTCTKEIDLAKLREMERNCPERHISVITLHEVMQQVISQKGIVFANIIKNQMLAMYKIHDLDTDIAIKSAGFSVGHQIPLADSMIAATALQMNLRVCTDDPHFTQIPKCKTVWIK
ncbi:MAG: hypothetical protein RBG13Loki_0601 [Promethearchaeota archaeon CR_4]|nr:MAG: hypothetical protein RBG13Loki_0601 [Candidatus Lokiarchaeota archaeon CR_4]